MNVKYRNGRKCDIKKIAELDYLASGGAVEYLFHDLVPDMTATEILCHGLEQDVYPHTFRSAIVGEIEHQVVGMALSYPAKYHRITKELREFLPNDRLKHFENFYSTRVESSYLLDAIAVFSEFQKKGIGNALLEKTKNKARDEGFDELSLIVFSDNENAIDIYEKSGFERVKAVDSKPHKLMSHDGGCVLMKCAI